MHTTVHPILNVAMYYTSMSISAYDLRQVCETGTYFHELNGIKIKYAGKDVQTTVYNLGTGERDKGFGFRHGIDSFVNGTMIDALVAYWGGADGPWDVNVVRDCPFPSLEKKWDRARADKLFEYLVHYKYMDGSVREVNYRPTFSNGLEYGTTSWD